MTRTSSDLQTHTESGRMMRGAWKTDYEYIFEPPTEESGILFAGCFVGWDVSCTRYSARVSDPTIGSVLEEAGSVSCL